MFGINFDMDGTLVDFYGVDGWLDDLNNYNTRPYEIAKPKLNMNSLAKRLNRLQKLGVAINIISWTSKTGTAEFNTRTAEAKKKWLKRHLHSVKFDNIYIVPYGTPKHTLASGLLFDDEIKNRTDWENNNKTNLACDENSIADTLRFLLE